jgi:2',3'-cyclic-nucleotide 2'-phosphodiesterase
MPDNQLRVILVGDVVGRHARRFTHLALPLIRQKYNPDLVIVNGENSAGGLGIIKRTADELFDAGADVITGGNHIWDKKEAAELLQQDERILKPLNYPSSTPGRGARACETPRGIAVMVISLQGRVFMDPVVDNPFTVIDEFLQRNHLPATVVDFHAEASAEKQALGFFLDGRVSAVLGTHTHVPTADARILPKGTAYQTDVGITGSLNSVIGMERHAVIYRFTTGMGRKFEVAKDDLVLDMTMVDIHPENGRAVRIEAFRIFESSYEQQLA